MKKQIITLLSLGFMSSLMASDVSSNVYSAEPAFADTSFDDAKPFKMRAGKSPGCTSKSSSALNDRCHAALKKFAIEHCIENNIGTKVKEVAGTYDFELSSGGECYNYPGSFYIATQCEAYFQCISG